jgi:hypothetical protein
MSGAIRIAHPELELHSSEKVLITDAEKREVARLLDRAADIFDAAVVILDEDDAAPAAMHLQRIRDLMARVDKMVERIGVILS